MTEARGLVVGLVIGVPILLLGVLDALGDAGRAKPFELVRWIVGLTLVLDLLVIPVALGVGRLVRSASLRWGLAASATVLAVAWPYVRGYGADPYNPSLLNRDYGTGTAVALGGIAAVSVGAWALGHRRVLGGRQREHEPGSE